jgi:hypothetical protein
MPLTTPYASFRYLPFGLCYIELGIRATRENDNTTAVTELASVILRRIYFSEARATRVFEEFLDFFEASEDDERLGV